MITLTNFSPYPMIYDKEMIKLAKQYGLEIEVIE